ncbi:uncharacterized protein [Struthio camelus]|uniref:uncharacterized protein n=1 Tax=Struthio camelus TaxID=8801 RepID=UPI0036041191
MRSCLPCSTSGPLRSGEAPEDWKRANATPNFTKGKKEDWGSTRPARLTLIPVKAMKQLILDTVSKHMKGKKVFRSSQRGFTKGKSCLTSLMEFTSVMGVTGWVDVGRAVDVVYLDFRKAFDAASHNILIDKLMKCGLEKWTGRWPENCLNCWAQRVVISLTGGQSLAMWSTLGPTLFNIFVDDLESRTKCMVSKLADNGKVGGAADTPDGCAAIQRDLKWLEKRASRMDPHEVQ